MNKRSFNWSRSNCLKDLPELIGSNKQKAWAYRIRDYYIEHCKFSMKIVRREKEANYWIKNKVKLIGEVELSPIKLPPLKGKRDHVLLAEFIRNSFSGSFPDAPLLKTETRAEFWIENECLFELMVRSGLKMDVDWFMPPTPTSSNVDRINLLHYPGISPLEAEEQSEAILKAICI